MFPLKHGGIALATSIASAVNVGMLWVILKRRIGTILDGEFYRSLGKTALASLVMWGVILLIGLLYPWDTAGPFDATADLPGPVRHRGRRRLLHRRPSSQEPGYGDRGGGSPPADLGTGKAIGLLPYFLWMNP